MISLLSRSSQWIPPQAPPPLPMNQLRIPNDFPAWTPPAYGTNPDWWPINAAQQAALQSPAQLLLYGGASGGGKSSFLVADAMQEYTNPNFRGLLLRESLGEMDQLGDEMERAYLPLRARYRGRSGGGEWKFPSGARVRFGYLASDKDLSKYRGNTKSWIGIDESGLQPANRVRAMIPWLIAVDPRLRVRMRFATNPGGVGHGWQMAAFLRNRCPLHYPASVHDSNPTMTSVWPGRVYGGASWTWPPSLSEMIHKTTAFFPASVTENPLYGSDKIDSLKSQTVSIQMQLLHGCWCNAESLYFGFMRPEWMIPYPSIQDEWWWNHVISIDYGYGNSSAAAGRYSIDENGRAFGTGEISEKKMGSHDFAKKICELWVKPRPGENAPRFMFVCIDPANDQHHDVGKSNFEIMAEVFAEYGIPCIKSHKGPADNAQNLYKGLSNHDIVLTDAMRQTFNAVSTRTIDERKAVKKIHGDPLDDDYDQLAYFWNTWIIESVKPDRMKLAESLNKMREAGADATALARRSMMETRKIEEKEKQQGKGLSLRRR